MTAIYVVTDQRPGEPDILTDFKHQNLIFKGHCGPTTEVQPPKEGWSHETIVREVERFNEKAVVRYDVWDAYLGEQWIGSTEV